MTTPTTDTAGLVERLRASAIDRSKPPSIGTLPEDHTQRDEWKAADLITRLTSPVEGLEELGEIEARANAATEGPWTNEKQNSEDGSFYFAIHGKHYAWIVNVEEDRNLGVAMKNSAFIAHARTDIPRLLAHIDSLSTRTSGMTEEVIISHEDDRIPDLVDQIREQNWKNGGVHRMDRDDAVALLQSAMEQVRAEATSQLSQGNGAEEMREAAAKVAETLRIDLEFTTTRTEAAKQYGVDIAASIRALPIPPAAKGEVTDHSVWELLATILEEVNDSDRAVSSVTRNKLRDLLAARKVRG